MDPGDRAALHAALRKIAPLSDDDLAPTNVARVRELAKGELLLRAGDRATECGSVISGIVRELYPLEDGREITRAFAGPGDSIGSLSDLLSGEPARAAAIAELDTRVAMLPWALIRELTETRAPWANFRARLTERLYLAKAAREYELLALDAEARYARFRTRYAALEAEIPLRAVASYIGVTPEHLSRLRRRESVQ